MEDRAAIGYDHGYDGQLFYLGLALDPAYIEGFVEGCLERIGEDNPDEEQLFRDLWQDCVLGRSSGATTTPRGEAQKLGATPERHDP